MGRQQFKWLGNFLSLGAFNSESLREKSDYIKLKGSMSMEVVGVDVCSY